MLLTLTLTQPPATDLGYLLHKNPARLHEASLGFGTAYLFYPEASAERCTVRFLCDGRSAGIAVSPPLEQPAQDIEPVVKIVRPDRLRTL